MIRALFLWSLAAVNSLGVVYAQDAVGARMPNEVLVLGTPHIAYWPEDVEIENLDPLIDRLETWRPQIIGIESIPGDECDLMRRQKEFIDEAETYCPDTKAARIATGLDVAAAIAERERLLSDWPSDPAPAMRRNLAAVMLAAGDPVSATIQWLYLAEADRIESDRLTPELVDYLNSRIGRRNENYWIAAPLAVQLGLQRVVQYDDQAVSIPIDDDDAYGKAISAAWNTAASEPSKREADARGPGLYSPEGVLDAYRLYNDPAYPKQVYARDFGAALADPSERQYGRQYVTYWETRNLRMAANIREAFGAHPGSRMLVIVGASHKGYLDAYLAMMRDVEIADAEDVLK